MTVTKEWLLVDARGQNLGRLASQVARLIRGKHKKNFTPHVDCGDNVVVINASEISLSGKKWDQKEYISHTGYPGGQKMIIAKDLMRKNNTKMVEEAIRGMLPKNRLGSEMFRNLYIYEGPAHDQEAQKPRAIDLKNI